MLQLVFVHVIHGHDRVHALVVEHLSFNGMSWCVTLFKRRKGRCMGRDRTRELSECAGRAVVRNGDHMTHGRVWITTHEFRVL